MSATVKVGIIGCGVIAPTHAASYQQTENAEIVWACDLVEAKARGLAEEFAIANVATDYRRLLDDPELDAVSVCTDHASHAPIAVAALEAGKHVLCEKALAATTEGLDAMVTAHGKRPELVFSGIFQHRFEQHNRILKRLVDEGRLGRLLTAGVQLRCLRTDAYYRADQWRGTWAQEGGAVLINQAIHFIDTLLWITGGAEAVCGSHANLTHGESMEAEDTAVASVRLKCGALATIEATCSSHLGWEPTLLLHGSAGSIEMRHDQGLKVKFADEKLAAEVESELAEARESGAASGGKTYYGPKHPAQIADFVEAIRDGRQPFVPAESARHTVDLVLALYRSHRDGVWVEVG